MRSDTSCSSATGGALGGDPRATNIVVCPSELVPPHRASQSLSGLAPLATAQLVRVILHSVVACGMGAATSTTPSISFMLAAMVLYSTCITVCVLWLSLMRRELLTHPSGSPSQVQVSTDSSVPCLPVQHTASMPLTPPSTLVVAPRPSTPLRHRLCRHHQRAFIGLRGVRQEWYMALHV